jgi:hypothetical protein
MARFTTSRRAAVDEDELREPTPEELALLEGPLANYAGELFRIKPKTPGRLVPLRFNRVQGYVDARLEAQRERLHMVRALILKGRQQGMSTYVAARYFRRTSTEEGVKTYILTHEAPATEGLFDKAKTAYDNLPICLRPEISKNTNKRLVFPALGSEYLVGTAGAEATGRSQTIQLFHGSEVAFWPDDSSHMAGVLQAVPALGGTEIILESTANGMQGVFYEMCQAAREGQGDFELIFVPWFWQEEYRRQPPGAWKPVDDELEYLRTYPDLEIDQLYWLHLKNIELGGKAGKICSKFRQEYPGNPQEAFQASAGEGLINSDTVMRARTKGLKPDEEDDAPRILGVDVARSVRGGDRTRMIDRCGRRAGARVNQVLATDDLMEIVGWIVKHMREHAIEHVFVDVTGVGAGVVDRARELGYGSRVHGINFGEKPFDQLRYRNKRAEMWDSVKEWLEDPGGALIPDDEGLHKHLCGPNFKYDSHSRLQLEDKDDIKKRLGFSPDAGDALALTFAQPVARRAVTDLARKRIRAKRPGGSWMRW